MDGEGAVLEDEADPPAGVLQQLLQRPLEPTAEGSLIVGELDDRDRRFGRALHHGRRDGQRDLRRRAHRPGADEPEPREDAYPTVVHSPRPRARLVTGVTRRGYARGEEPCKSSWTSCSARTPPGHAWSCG